jgi:hypothetical protein
MPRLYFDPVYLGLLLREKDSNLRPLGYEPNKLPLLYPTICSQDRIRTCEVATIKDVIDHLSHYAIPDYFLLSSLLFYEHTVTGCLFIYLYLRSDWFALDLYESGSHLTDSNRRPSDYKSEALPTELRGLVSSITELQLCQLTKQ